MASPMNHNIVWNDKSKEDIACCLSIPNACSSSLLIQARTITLGKNKEQDRRAFARRAVAAGEVLARNAPLAFVVDEPKERCGACFQTRRTPTIKLSRCGKCRHAWYCSRDCQVKDFPLHRIECREASTLLAGNKQCQRNARLLIRTYVAMALQEVKNDELLHHSCRLTDTNVCVCSSRHFQQLQQSTTRLDPEERQNLQLAVQVLMRQNKTLHRMGVEVGGGSSVLQQHLESILRRFRVNNFGMVDDMVRLVGGGVYPLGALLNHSCAPNCLLRYTTKGGVLEIVAARAISKGGELTHSYIELVAPTHTRQERLREIYEFACDCQRCQSALDVVPLPMDYIDWDASDLVEYVLEKFNPLGGRLGGVEQQLGVVKVPVDELLQPAAASSSSLNIHVIQQVRILQQQANLVTANEDLERELDLLSKAVMLLEKKTNSSSIPYFALELYKVRCQRLSTWIVAQQPEKALEDCRHIVAVLCVALAKTPNHSLLGLQLFTLGDLYEACGQTERATDMYRWAKVNLTISQGPTSEMVQLLNSKLQTDATPTRT